MQKSDGKIGQIWQFVKEGVRPVDFRITGCVSRSKEGFAVMDCLLHYAYSAKKESIELVVPVALRQSWMDEGHCEGFSHTSL